MNKNPELSSPFSPFFGRNNLLPLTEMKYFGPQAFRVRAEKSYIIRLVNSKLVVKAVFSSMMHSLYQGPARELKRACDFGRFLCCWLAELRVHENTS